MVERSLYHNQKDKYVHVPCGKCPECLKRRTASWSFRLEVEALNWQQQFFLTLTYDNEHVPISPNGFLSLRPNDVTLFFKRLRKRAGKLRYYYCGEYGTGYKRPHYHLLLFGQSSLQASDIIAAWHHGTVHFGKIESGSITYTVQYYDKGVWAAEHGRDDREPEYSRMSKGIGQSFLTNAQVKAFLDDPSKGYVYNKEGHKIAIPRYYKKRLYDYLGSDKLVANHPSILIHRDEMIDAKERHNNAMADIIESMEQPELTEELWKDRAAAIETYRQSKRKTRK